MTALAPKDSASSQTTVEPVTKMSTEMEGFDLLTGGGLPAGRLTTIIGPPGAGKTVFTLQTLVNRQKYHGEACIFVAFEESVDRIRRNIAAFNWELGTLGEPEFNFVDARLSVDATLSGAFDLSGLLAGLAGIQAATGARNIVFDGIDMLLTSLRDEQLERVELTRVNEWIAASGLTALMTAKSFASSGRDQARADFLQYITDCVIELAEMKTPTAISRTLRVAKYRGSGFNPNPLPCVIDETGINVIAFRSARTDYPVYTDRVSSGVPRLDALLGGGYLRGSGILVSGAPGTAKSSLAASFANAACARGETTLLISFDEGGAQIVRNMASIGIDLQSHIDRQTLRIESLLSSGQNAENHFIRIRDIIRRTSPRCLVIDPISAFQSALSPFSQMICDCLLDELKTAGITVLCTSLLEQKAGGIEASASQISTIADTWLHVSYVAHEGERNRALTIVKARGTSHSNQVRELVIGAGGITLVDVYAAEGAVLMGTARAQKEAENALRETADDAASQRNRLRLERELAELSQSVHLAKMELEWKEREAAIVHRADAERLVARRLATDRRQVLRRSDDDLETPSIFPNGGPV